MKLRHDISCEPINLLRIARMLNGSLSRECAELAEAHCKSMINDFYYVLRSYLIVRIDKLWGSAFRHNDVILLLSFARIGIFHFDDDEGLRAASLVDDPNTFDFIIIKHGLSFRCKQLINFTTLQITYFLDDFVVVFRRAVRDGTFTNCTFEA